MRCLVTGDSLKRFVKPIMALSLMALSSAAQAVNLVLIAHNQTSSGGTNSTLITDGAHPIAGPSTAVWDWDGTTLTSTGLYSAVVAISSNPNNAAVLSDQVTDLAIDTSTGTGDGTAYSCLEGTFLSTVGASGCGGHNLGANFQNESTTTWGPGLALSRTIGGDDVATGPQRDIAAYDFGTLEYEPDTITSVDDLKIGDRVLIGNGIEFVRNPGPGDSTFPGAELLTFIVEASAVDDSVSITPGVQM